MWTVWQGHQQCHQQALQEVLHRQPRMLLSSLSPRAFSSLSTHFLCLSIPASGQRHGPMSLVHQSRKSLRTQTMRHKWEQDSQVLPRVRPPKKPPGGQLRQALTMNMHLPRLQAPYPLCPPWLQPLKMAPSRGRESQEPPQWISVLRNTVASSPSSCRCSA